MGTTPTAVLEQMETIPIVHIQTPTTSPVSTFTRMEQTTIATELMDIMAKT